MVSLFPKSKTCLTAGEFFQSHKTLGMILVKNKKKKALNFHENLLTIPVGKPYCWQACSPANLIPLQVYNSNFDSQSIKITNYF